MPELAIHVFDTSKSGGYVDPRTLELILLAREVSAVHPDLIKVVNHRSPVSVKLGRLPKAFVDGKETEIVDIPYIIADLLSIPKLSGTAAALGSLVDVKLAACIDYLLWEDLTIRYTFTNGIVQKSAHIETMITSWYCRRNTRFSDVRVAVHDLQQCLARLDETLDTLLTRVDEYPPMLLRVKLAAYLSILFSIAGDTPFQSLLIKYRSLTSFCQDVWPADSQLFLGGLSRTQPKLYSFWEKLVGTDADDQSEEFKAPPSWQQRAFVFGSIALMALFLTSGRSALGTLDEDDYDI